MSARCGGARADGFRNAPRSGLLREAEVEDFCLAARGDENVRGLDVAVDDPPRVGRIQRIGNLDAGFKQRFERHGTAGCKASGLRAAPSPGMAGRRARPRRRWCKCRGDSTRRRSGLRAEIVRATTHPAQVPRKETSRPRRAPRRVSSARNTWPMPPLPTGSRMR